MAHCGKFLFMVNFASVVEFFRILLKRMFFMKKCSFT